MNVFILGQNSDIGKELAERYRDAGADVTITSKREEFVGPWDRFISCIGTLTPIGPFFGVDFKSWEASLHVNVSYQLSVLHSIWPQRNGKVGACFFAGGGTNGPMDNYSAYAASKVMLIKMCELLDSENPDLTVFAVGPGFVKTKIHKQTLVAAQHAGDGRQKTMEFLKTDGTSHDDIFKCLEWCFTRDKVIISGRNVSVVHDPWRSSGLGKKLFLNTNLYKLRRFS